MPGRVVLVALLLVGCAPARHERPTSRFDLDGDGRAELLALQSWDGAIVAIDGAGTIERTVLGPPVIDEPFPAPRWEAIRVADMDGDGRGELVRWWRPAGTVAIHRGGAEVEAAPWIELDLGPQVSARRAGDVNGDGLADLWAVQEGRLTLVLGDRTTPRLGPSFEVRTDAVATDLDLDGDGRSDVVASGGGGWIWRGGSAEPIEVPLAERWFVAGGEGAPADPDAPSRSLLPVVRYGAAGLEVELRRWTGSTLEPTGWTGDAIPVDRGQLLGDERIDLLWERQPCEHEVGELDGERVPVERAPLDGCEPTFVAGDLDGDGFDDLAATVREPDDARGLEIVFGGRDALRSGPRIVPPEVEATTALRGGFAAGADLDGDGHADYAVLDEDERCLQVLWGAPRSPALVTQQLCQVDVVTAATLRGLGAQDDVPGDELLWGDRVVRIARTGLVTLTSASPALIPVGDVNDDGFMDLALDGALVLGGANVTGGTQARTTLPGLVQATFLGDVSGDGVDDLGVGGDVHFGGPDVASSAPAIVGIGFLGVGDHDGDGRAELGVLLRSERPFVDLLSIQRWDGALVEIARVELTLPIRRCGDLDGDGREELASWDTVWSGGSAVPAAGDCPGDLDGDGLDDFVLQSGSYFVSWGARPFSVDDATVVQRPLTRADLALAPVW